MSTSLLYITTSSPEEARAIALTLLQEKKVACANVFPGVTSLFYWEGALQEAQEAVLILKTVESAVPGVIERVKQLHSYECPCIVEVPISQGNPAFLKWLASSVDIS